MIESMDPNFYILPGLALHLEHASLTTIQNSISLPLSVCKKFIQALLEEIISQEDFLLFNGNSL